MINIHERDKNGQKRAGAESRYAISRGEYTFLALRRHGAGLSDISQPDGRC